MRCEIPALDTNVSLGMRSLVYLTTVVWLYANLRYESRELDAPNALLTLPRCSTSSSAKVARIEHK
jgi:hypothetical protein